MYREHLAELSGLMVRAKNQAELETLLDGLLTPSEIEEIMFRWRLLILLLRGRTQRDISKELGVSLGKIARGSRLLKYGPPEIRELIVRLEKSRGGNAET